jgi:hypothetical protein
MGNHGKVVLPLKDYPGGATLRGIPLSYATSPFFYDRLEIRQTARASPINLRRPIESPSSDFP